jgi:hypothetical protein
MPKQYLEPITPIVIQLGAGNANVLANIPLGYHYEIVSVLICNTANAQRTFRLHLHATALVAAQANALAYDTPINANTIYNMPFGAPIIIPAGYRITGSASLAASVNVILTGYIVSDVG